MIKELTIRGRAARVTAAAIATTASMQADKGYIICNEMNII